MAIQYRGNRIQCLAADSLPTTGVTIGMVAECCDNNHWKYFTGTSWTDFGANALQPIGVIPGDVNATSNTNINPNSSFPWISMGNYTEVDTVGRSRALNFMYLQTVNTTLNQNYPDASLIGQKLVLLPAATTLTWNGYTWA